jgi:hypothetical protein
MNAPPMAIPRREVQRRLRVLVRLVHPDVCHTGGGRGGGVVGGGSSECGHRAGHHLHSQNEKFTGLAQIVQVDPTF